MKRTLKQSICTALALVLVLSLAACGGGAQQPSSSAPAAPPPTSGSSQLASASSAASESGKDTLKVALQREVNDLTGFTGNNVAYGIAYMIFDTLVQLNEDMSVRPGLATSWEQVDDYTWRFSLREGIKFTNGEPFNAEVAAYSVNYMAGLDSGYQNWKQWGPSWPPEASVESEYTILIKTPAPNISLPNMMTRGSMIPLEASKTDGFWANPIGTGAYKLANWEPGSSITLEANADYWDGEPKIRNIHYDIIKDGTARSAAIQTGEYDFVCDVPQDFANVMTSNNTTEMDLLRTDSTGMAYLYFNSYSSNKFIQDAKFRQAMITAIDHKAIIDVIMGGLVPQTKGIAPMDLAGAYDAGGYPDRDVEKAKQMAAECGYHGEEIIYMYASSQFNNDVEVIEFILSQLQEAGFNIKYQEVDSSAWSAQYKNTDAYDISANGYGGTYTGDTEQYYTQGVRNLGWKFDECEELLGKIYSEGITQEARAGYLSGIMKVCWDQGVYLFAAQRNGLWAVNPNLKGYEIYPHNQTSFTKAYFE